MKKTTPNTRLSKHDKLNESTNTIPHKRPHHYITQSVKNGVYTHTMHHVHHDLKSSERTVSYVIHQPSIESISDLIGVTIMQPYAVLGGALCMVVGGFGILFAAYYIGFTVSPFLLPVLYIVGFLTTLVVHICLRLLRGIKRKLSR